MVGHIYLSSCRLGHKNTKLPNKNKKQLHVNFTAQEFQMLTDDISSTSLSQWRPWTQEVARVAQGDGRRTRV